MHKKGPPEAGLSRNTWFAVLLCRSQTVSDHCLDAISQDLTPAAAEATNLGSVTRRAGLDHRSRTLRSSPIDGTREYRVADRIPEFEYKRGFADSIQEHAAAANRVRRYARDDVEQAYMYAEHIRTGFLDDFKYCTALEFFQECSTDLILKQRPGIGIELEFAGAGSRPNRACSCTTTVWAAVITVFDAQIIEHDFGNACQVDILTRPDGIHDCAINTGQAIVGDFGIRARLKFGRRRAAGCNGNGSNGRQYSEFH